jgi:glycerophosphoryl diester phosphodiesterase
MDAMAHDRIQVIASCGVHEDVPPNTLAAFEAAIRAGCDMTETDFRRCADGVIIFHDHQAGGRPVSSLTRREIREAAGVLPPTLDDFIECCRGRLGVDFELKEDGLEEEVLEALSPYFRPDQFVITSFLPSVLRRVKALDATAPTGLLTMRGLSEYIRAHPETADLRSPSRVIDQARALDADFLLPDVFDTELLQAASAAGVATIAWAVSSVAQMRELAQLSGLHGMITEDPALLRRVLEDPLAGAVDAHA